MIQKLVERVLKMPAGVVLAAAGVVLLGIYAYTQLDIEAYPNPVAPMIEVITQPDGWSAEEVERYVTIPLETGLAGMRSLDHLRSQSLFGLSDVKCYFTWAPDYYAAQQEVINRLQFIQLPQGLAPQLSPANAIGEIFRYQLQGKGYSLDELKTAEDWVLERQFKQVPGVIDVTSFGGESRQYHVEVDPLRMRGQAITLSQVISGLANSNQNVGGGRMQLGEQSFDVRGVGLIQSLKDIAETVLTFSKGIPIRLKDIATVALGASPRLGLVGKDEEPDIVEGIVLMRYGGDSLKTLEGVHRKVEEIRKYHLLPPGMELVPYYDREKLVGITTHTVLENLLLGMLLVSLVLWAFLGHLRAAAVTAVNIPIALMMAFMGMVATGTPANLISLGAVDFGIVVDSTVIMVENIFRHLARGGAGSRVERISEAAGEVGPPMFFSTLIIAVAFIPLFTLSGVAGVIFSPMAHTYAFAIGGAILMAMTLTPNLAQMAIPDSKSGPDSEAREDHGNALMRGLDRLYRPLFRFALTHRGLAVALALAPVALGAALAPRLGREFMPHLEEGNFWIRATLPLSISLEQSAKYVGRMRRILLGCSDTQEACDLQRRANPEVETVVSQLGRPDDGTDVSGFFNIEFFAPLAPFEAWPRGVTKDSLTADLSKKLAAAFPGVVFNFSQYISDNVEEALSGVKGENTVKVMGPDIRVDEQRADQIVEVLSGIRGVEDLGLLRSLGQPNIRITPDRNKAGRYGLNVGDVEAVVQAALGGQAVTQVYEGERHYDLTVRFAPGFRQDLAAIRDLPVNTPDGSQVPLAEIAEVAEEEGASLVYREDQQRYVPVKFSVRGRDLASTIGEAQARISERVKLPYDTHLEWSGEINQLNETTGRLAIILPVTLLLIGFLSYASVKSWRDTLIALLGIPVACTGGVLALLATGTHFSISAAMGFISIFGIAIQDSLIVITYAQRLWDQGHDLIEGARLAAERRLRPVLMTTCVAMLGLTPAALSHGIGSETQRPLAIVVIGGALILAILPRLLQPALLVLAHRGEPRWATRSPA